MNAIHARTSRRTFFVAGGAALGAGVATSIGAAALAPKQIATAEHELAAMTEREAIRGLHVAFMAAVESQSHEAAATNHQAYRPNAQQHRDSLSLSEDHHRASATWHVDVKLGTPLQGDSTAAQMARLQGHLSEVRWESGALRATYLKSGSEWRIAALEFSVA